MQKSDGNISNFGHFQWKMQQYNRNIAAFYIFEHEEMKWKYSFFGCFSIEKVEIK